MIGRSTPLGGAAGRADATARSDAPRISLIVGLGNPGGEYALTRHNVGFRLVDALAASAGEAFREEARFHGSVCRIPVGRGRCWLLKPATFMNHSGRCVGAFLHFYRLSLQSMLVVHDDLDLSPGTVRLKCGGGHGGPTGLRDIIAVIGEREFYRARIGIGHPGDRDCVVQYVLSRPAADDAAAMREAIEAVCEHLPAIVGGKLQLAMNTLHARR